VAALGFWLASRIVPGVHVGGWGSLLAAGVLLGVVNAFVRPIIVVLTLPLTIVTLGLFLLVINAVMVELATLFLRHQITIDTFWHAVLAALVISLTSWVGNWFIGPRDERD
jgi:putative membrane protein